jgi:hypothetical protein
MLVKNDDRAIARSFSLNLNVATMLSQAFLDFDASLRPGARGTIVLEVQLIDAFADLAAFYFARDFAKERGYRVCLDGSTHLTLPYLERERLGVDLVKLSWRPDIADLHQSGRLGELRDAVAALGRTRSILCHCDTAQAIEVGQACGINLFQGRHVDRLLAAASRSAPPPGTPRLAAPG